jgi:signal transduction histidine kinase/ActR/RegA family two-component response regulator
MTPRADLSVGQRLGIGLGVVGLVIVLLGAATTAIVVRVQDLVHRETDVIEPRADAADALKRTIYHTAIAGRAYALTREPRELETLRRAVNEAQRTLRQLEGMPQDPASRRLFDAVVPLHAAHQDRIDDLLELLRDNGTVASSAAMTQAESTLSRSREALLEAVRLYQARQLALAVEARGEVRAAVARLTLTIAAAAVLVLVATGVTIALVGRSIREPAGRLAAAAHAVAAGDYAPALALAPVAARTNGTTPRLRDELRELARGFARMAELLRHREERLAARARLGAALGGSLDPGPLAGAALTEIADHLRGEVGVVYAIAAGDGRLRPLATRALDGHLAELRIGDGIPGQAAADRRTYVVRDIPDDTPFRVRLGVDDAPPRWVAASPLVTRGTVVGVLVVGGLGTLAEDAVEFLEDAAARLAVSVDNARAHVELTRLGAQLQAQNERLHAQNQELQVQGEELQSQNEELQAQGEELQAQAEELHAQAEELQAHTEQLQEHRNELERRNEALAQAERRKNEFLAMLGHELRNPLGAISAAAGLLRVDRQRDPEPARAVAVIARQARHLARLVDDLLDVSRITHGAIALAVRPLDLGEVVARTVETVRVAVEEGGRQVTVLTEPVWVEGDEIRLEQIVGNLVTNAFKYTSPGGWIAVSVTRDGGQAVLRVEDDGVGISADLLPQIFDLFVQQARSSDRARGGLGIGLTLVRHLVELHGGTVAAASAGTGKGATFTVRFRAITPPTASPEAAPTASTTRWKCSLVVAEDHADAREMLRVLLGRAGHDVHEADSGPGAVAAVTSVRPDVALVDVDLPGFDGYEVARRVRARPELAGTWLVAVTGYGRSGDRQRALAAGFDAHLVKPVDPERVLEVIDGLRARGRRGDACPAADVAPDRA